MPLHVLHCYKGYPPVVGGIEHHVHQVAAGFGRRGHRVDVVTAAAGGEPPRDEGVTVHRHWAAAEVASTPLAPGLVADLVRRLSSRDDPVDLVHLHAPFPPAEVAALAAVTARRGPPVVVTYHADVVRQRWLGAAHRPVQRRLLRRAAAVVATSEAYRRSSPQLRDLSNVEVVPLGVDPEPFAEPRPAPAGLGPFVLFAGRLRHYKGVDQLLHATPRLPPGATVVVAGDGPEGQALHDLAARLGIGDRVRFLGEVADATLVGLLQHAVALALPATNRAEAFGTVQLEAMAAGTPVVSTRLGTGVDEVNEHGVTGLTVPVGDAEALAGALTTLVEDPEQARRLGAAGRARVQERYTVEQMLDRLEALSLRVAGSGTAVTDRG